MVRGEYPNQKQIDKKTKEVERLLRLYITGHTKPIMVRNALKCLFTDVMLDITNHDMYWKSGNFEQMIKDW